jgi:cholesterol transport system auxiliary component
MRRFLPLLAPVLAAVLLSGCSVLSEPSPQNVYQLPPSTLVAGQGQGSDLSLRITRPEASGLLDGVRILVSPEANRFSVYQDVRWYAPAPLMWRDHLLDAFRNDGRIRRLSNDSDGVQPDFELGGTLRAFQSEYRAGRPYVVISVDLRLIDNASKKVRSGRRFTVEEAVDGARIPEVVAAFGRASDTLDRELIAWTLEQLPERQ